MLDISWFSYCIAGFFFCGQLNHDKTPFWWYKVKQCFGKQHFWHYRQQQVKVTTKATKMYMDIFTSEQQCHHTIIFRAT